MILTKTWLMYVPSPNDVSAPSIVKIFSNTPRLMIVGLLVYAICQRFDVWMYHKVWAKTDDISKDHHKFMWVRNNMSTMLSQLLNTILFTFGAFYGVYDMPTLINIFISSYLIFFILALVDTGFLYIARFLYENGKVSKEISL